MMGLEPNTAPIHVNITDATVMVLPEPVTVTLKAADLDGTEITLRPLRTGPVLAGSAGASTWQEAILSALTACAGVDPDGLDVRHLPRVLKGAAARLHIIRTRDGEHVLVGVAP